jgi:heme-degrading monooxygenase HmoA
MTDSTASAVIVRTWRGVIRSVDRDTYSDYLDDTGMDEYQRTPGNLGAWVLYRDLGDGRTEVVTVSRWSSRAAIAGFAGDDIEQAVFYPEDDRFLLERDSTVRHYEQLAR